MKAMILTLHAWTISNCSKICRFVYVGNIFLAILCSPIPYFSQCGNIFLDNTRLFLIYLVFNFIDIEIILLKRINSYFSIDTNYFIPVCKIIFHNNMDMRFICSPPAIETEYYIRKTSHTSKSTIKILYKLEY